MYVLDFFEDDLKELGLHKADKATCFGIKNKNFFVILELYCPAAGTFFMPVGELRMALHEMWEVLNLPMGSVPYEEYFPCVDELKQFRKRIPALFETYRELMYYFYIYLDINCVSESTNSLKTWVKYLFPILDKILEDLQLVEDVHITNMMVSSGHEDIVLDEDDGEYEKGDIFLSFHHQDGRPLS